MKITHLAALLSAVILLACGDAKNEQSNGETSAKDTLQNPLFTLLSPEESGFYFLNEVKQSQNFNVMTYENFYNGAGVGVGDVNNDGLPDVFMTGNTFGGRLYLNKGNMQFEQISETANVFHRGFTTDVSFVDINGDGYQDIYLCRSMVGQVDFRKNILLINNQDNTFTDKAEQYGVADAGYSNQSLFFDYDNDGDLDLYVMNHRVDFDNAFSIYDATDAKGNFEPGSMFWNEASADRLYRNNGNQTFTDVMKTAGIANNDFSLSAVPADLNNDGWMDIYIANDFSSKDHAYINQGDGTFRDELEERFGHIPLSSMGMDIADYNNDGFLDVVNLDMTPEDNYRQKQLKSSGSYDKYHMAVDFGFYHQVTRNMLHLNNGEGTFSEVGQLAGMAYTDWSWSSLFADFDNDGYQDLFISNGHYRDITDLDYLKFRSVKAVEAAGGYDHVQPLDLINLMTSTKIQNYMYRNTGGLRLHNETQKWGLGQPSHSNGAAYADLDLDGDLDLIVNNYNQPSFLYRNNSREQQKGNYLQVMLQGPKENPNGYGARVRVTAGNGAVQVREVTPYRGFLSSVEAIAHFGLNKDDEVKVEVLWPGGKWQEVSGVKANQRITMNITDAGEGRPVMKPERRLMQETTMKLAYSHQESNYNDFKQEPLMEHMLSDRGPVMATADVNGDDQMDFYVGGSAGSEGALFLRKGTGFVKKAQATFAADKTHEDGGCAFFDANNDGFVDLYVSSGSNEFAMGAIYQDRLYLNDGKGNFSRSKSAIPEMTAATSCVLPFDMDGDGDLDIFVGGFAKRNQYPLAYASMLFENEGGTFKDVSDRLPRKGDFGIVHDAAWTNNQLLVVGEWQPIRVLQRNEKGDFAELQPDGLAQSGGWWNCMAGADFDGDGDIDFIVGNRGENTMFKASKEHPAAIFWGDFDQNGDHDAVPAYYYPTDQAYFAKHSLDELFMQMKKVRRDFPDYASYSKASLEQVVPSDASSSRVHAFSTSYLENKGNGSWQLSALPVEAQVSFVQDILIHDVNGDGQQDVLLVGNQYNVDVYTGRSDASYGLVLLNDKGKFTPMNMLKSGFNTHAKDARAVHLLDDVIVVGNNNGSLQFFELRK